MKNHSILILIFLMPFITYADQFVYVTLEQAQQAKIVLEKNKEVIAYCSECSDTSRKYIKTDSVGISSSGSRANVTVYGKTQYSEKTSDVIDMAYYHIKVNGKAVSLAQILKLYDSKGTNKILKSFKDSSKPFNWWFPSDTDKYWEPHLLSSKLKFFNQSFRVRVGEKNDVEFDTLPKECYIGKHINSMEISLNPSDLSETSTYLFSEYTSCNKVVSVSHNFLNYNLFEGSAETKIPIALAHEDKIYLCESLNLTITSKDGGIHEISSLSPNFESRLGYYINEVPSSDKSFYNLPTATSSLYQKGLVKIDVATFVNKEDGEESKITLKNFCIVPTTE
jgi:hypothetical protein